MRYRKVGKEHQVHHVDLYIRSDMGSNESDTPDSLMTHQTCSQGTTWKYIYTGVPMVVLVSMHIRYW